MKVIQTVLAWTIVNLSSLLAQGTLTVTTDKLSYSYGEPIKVRLTIANKTANAFTLRGSSTCIVRIGFNRVPFRVLCTGDDREFQFPPGVARIWVWNLHPAKLGIPDKEGTQTIYGFVEGGMKDSVLIQAPKYYGGRLSVGIRLGVPAAAMQSLRDSINASVLSSDTSAPTGTIREMWQVSGHTIDSIVAVYSGDNRFKWIEASRPLFFDEEIVTAIPGDPSFPSLFSLSQNYPNPFNPSTTIEFTLPMSAFVTLRVYDLLGRQVGELVNERLIPGTYKTQWDARGLASGVYFYRLQAGHRELTRKLVIIR